MRILPTTAYLSIGAFLIFSCHKAKTENLNQVDVSDIIYESALHVNSATYSDLASKANELNDAVAQFVLDPNDANLMACRASWKAARSAWEKSEGFLYGPVATENIDPRIDSWPVDFNAIETELNGTIDFSVESNIDALDDALKGFHPIEYMLWGENGQKTPVDFTYREKQYLQALSNNLKKLTSQLANQWESTQTNAFIHHFIIPNAQNPFYQTYRSVLEQMVNGMIDICDEVASGKIGEPYLLQDSGLEESPFSANSMEDFKNNIKSVQNAYLGKYVIDGYGIEELVRKYNLTLDSQVKQKINNAIAALNTVTDPFGTALSTQQLQIQNSIQAIEELKDLLKFQLLPFVQQKVVN